MVRTLFRRFAFVGLAALASASYLACGGNGAKTGTQTGDEGDGSYTTGADSTSNSTPSTSGATTGGNATNTGGTMSSASGADAAVSGNDSSSTSSSNATGSGGTSSGGSTNDSTSNTSAGGVAGSETGSDAPQTVSTTGGGAAGGECDPACGFGFECCDGECVNPANDIHNCGACGVACEDDSAYCSYNECTAPPCDGASCDDGETCCGSECCGAGQLCCLVNQGPSILGCFEPVNGTCPVGCPDCDCAAPDTPIATPSGERPIASLSVGDLVYSVDEHGIVVVPIVQVNRVSVENHHVIHVLLRDGTELRISPRHPLFGSGVFGDLAKGSTLGEKKVLEATPVPYDLPYTYDILPGSSTGAYFAGGALIGSTLAD